MDHSWKNPGYGRRRSRWFFVVCLVVDGCISQLPASKSRSDLAGRQRGEAPSPSKEPRRNEAATAPKRMSLKPEEACLEVDATAESDQLAVGSDDPVAGDDHGYRIGPHGLPDGPGAARKAQRFGDLSVRA
jgi:hypothetical protein